MSLGSGARLGPYEIATRIGTGGMGEVYRARDVRLGRDVAVKVLPEAFGADFERRSRFIREAQLASSLNHPNIVTIYDVGEADGVHYIAMELVEGRTLAEVIRDPQQPLHLILQLAAQIADALARSHAAGIVHRDLKPSNVMITADHHAKLLDFGLGRQTSQAPAPEMVTVAGGDVTTPGMMLGTTSYMAPEQGRGEPADYRSDQFAFGILLYEWITRQHPFQRASPIETLSAIIGEPAAPISQVSPAVPESLELIVERCLAKDPAERFASTIDLAHGLRDIADHLKSGRRMAVMPASRARRPAWLVGAVAVALLLPIGGAGWLWFGTTDLIAGEKQIAVLPFTSIGGDAANQALTDGLVEVLTTRLAQAERVSGALWVVPASEVRQQQIASARDARRAFGVNLVVTGSVQRTANRLLITMNLIDAVSLRQTGGDTISAPVADAAALQADVVNRLLQLVEADVDGERQNVILAGSTTAPAAYEYYLEGRGYLQRPGAENLDLALELFERARAVDPNYGLAHAAIAEASWRKFEATKDTAWVGRARDAAAQALTLSPRLTPVRITQGIIASGTGRYEEAVEVLRSVVEEEPTSADAYRELARAYAALGDIDAAEATFKRAIAARPGDWLAYNALGAFYFSQRRPAEAAQQFEKVVALTPDNARGHTNLGSALATLDRLEEAIAVLERAAALRPTGPSLSNLGTAYFRQRRFAEAVRAFERAIEMGVSNYQVWLNLGSAYRQVPGTEDKARVAFTKAAELGERELEVNPRQPPVMARLSVAYAELGMREKARSLIEGAERLAPASPQVLLTAAGVYDALGERPRALDALRAALAAGATEKDVQDTRALDGLRADPAYAQLRR